MLTKDTLEEFKLECELRRITPRSESTAGNKRAGSHSPLIPEPKMLKCLKLGKKMFPKLVRFAHTAIDAVSTVRELFERGM